MKQHILIMAVTIGLLGPAMAYDPEPTETPTPTASATPIVMGGCNKASRDTAAYCFYGNRAQIIKNLSALPPAILERRVFLQVTQIGQSATIKLYEQEEGGTFTVTKWSHKETPRLLTAIDRAIMENKGESCVGDKVKAVLFEELKKETEKENVPAPASTTEAFSDSIPKDELLFIKTTVFVLC